MRKSHYGGNVLALAFLAPIVFLAISAVIVEIQFDIAVTSRLRRAANASTIEIAQRELNAALINIRERDLTSGSTHIFYATPDTDLAFWYTNINDAHTELVELKASKSDPLTESNQLIKLREALLDADQAGSVTLPQCITIYPKQRSWFAGWVLSVILATLGMLLVVVGLADHY